jgi:hypothetical protein
MREMSLLALVLIVACTPQAPSSLASDEQELLELHQAGLTAHLTGDIDALLAGQADDFILVNRGEVTSPSRKQRRDFLGPYLASTKFEFYRDAIAPIVKISRDGSLGWVIARVEARGVTTTTDDRDVGLEFAVAWIELYERRGHTWTAIGNVSSFESAK